MRIKRSASIGSVGLLLACPTIAGATIIGTHAFTWWDDPVQGVFVTNLGGPSPTAAAVPLFDLQEWHLNQAQTSTWYSGGNIAGMGIANPFNPVVHAGGLTGGSVLPGGMAGAQAFIYQITNRNYGSGNGLSFSFGKPGANDLSGINIIDTHGALAFTGPAANSQFMFTPAGGGVLDLTPGHLLGSQQDWDFNAFAGAGNFEWDIPNEPGPVHPAAGPLLRGGVSPGTSGIFGFAMPGNWLDAVNNGWAHSWDMTPAGVLIPSSQVNVTPAMFGFSGPMMGVPTPSALSLLALSVGVAVSRRRR